MSYTNIISNITIPGSTVTGTSGPGYTITNNGSAASAWAWSTSGPSITTDTSLRGNNLKVIGDADISGELTVQGVKLSERLDRIEERLAILRPNEEMEEKWDNLRALRNMYMELEAEIKEKEEIWKILKK